MQPGAQEQQEQCGQDLTGTTLLIHPAHIQSLSQGHQVILTCDELMLHKTNLDTFVTSTDSVWSLCSGHAEHEVIMSPWHEVHPCRDLVKGSTAFFLQSHKVVLYDASSRCCIVRIALKVAP